MMFNSYCHDEEVTRYLTWNPHQNLDETKAFLAFKLGDEVKPYHYAWAILKDGVIIGSIDTVSLLADGGVEIGYCLARKEWGQGYMSEAFHAVLGFLFEKGPFKYVIMRAEIENVRSRRVIEKQGFLFQYEDEQELPLKKKTVRVAVYALEKDDFVK